MQTPVTQPGPTNAAICVVDPQTLQVTVLHRTWLSPYDLSNVAVAQWPGLASVPVAGFDMAAWPTQLDWKQARFTNANQWARSFVLPAAAGARPRLLSTENGETPDQWHLGERDTVSGDTLQRLEGGGAREEVLIGSNHGGANGLAGASPMWTAYRNLYWSFQTMPSWGDRECVATNDGVIWMAIPRGQNIGECHRAIVGYRPAPSGSRQWTQEDQWIGPFAAPDGQNISGLLPDAKGGVWVSTGGAGGLFNVSAAGMIESARRSGDIRSTDTWRLQYEKRVRASGWRSEVRLLISKGQFADALRLLDACPPTDAPDVTLYRAYAAARAPDRWQQAADLYDQIIAREDTKPAEKMLSFCNRILVLRKSRQWQELLSTIERYRKLFPQTATSTGPYADSLEWITQDAKNQLAATRPSTK